MGPFGQNCTLGHCYKLGRFCLQEIEFQLKVAFRYGVCCLTLYHLTRSPEAGGFKVASFNGLTKTLEFFFFFFKLNFIYLCGCTGSSLLCGLFFSFRPSGGYSLFVVCGLLTASGFSCCRARAQGARASAVVAHETIPVKGRERSRMGRRS